MTDQQEIFELASSERGRRKTTRLRERNGSSEVISSTISLSGHMLETLWEREDVTVFRSQDSEEHFLVIAPRRELTADTLARFEHEYALRDQLDPAWAARPVALSREPTGVTLLLTDCGGEPLARRLGQPLAEERGLK